MLDWNKTDLLQALPEFDWQHLPKAGRALQPYCDFYRLRFSEASVHYAGRLSCAGYQLAVQSWAPAQVRGTAILVHGYYDHTGIYGSLIRFCLQQQLQVLIVDLPGHGLSGGEPAAIGSFQEYDEIFSVLVQRAQQFLPAPLHVFGQSTGGAIIVNYVLKRQLQPAQSPFASINLLSPLVRPWRWQQVKMLQPLLGPFLRQLKRTFHPNSSDTVFLDFIARHDPLQPRFLNLRWVRALRHWVPFIEAQPPLDLAVNIVQGDQDGTVAWPHNLQVLQQKFPQRRLHMLAGAGHQLVNESEALRERLYAQLASWLHDQPDASVSAIEAADISG